MFRFLCDEDFDNDVMRGLARRCPGVEFVRVQDVGLTGRDRKFDPEVLAWAATDGSILLTSDRTTMTAHAKDRLTAGEPMLGIIVVRRDASMGRLLDDLVAIVECSEPSEYVGRIVFVPL